MVRHPLMVQWVIGSIPWSYFPFQSVDHDWMNKACGLCYPDYEMVHIKDLLLLIEKSSPCSGGSGFPLSLFEWSYIIVNKMC